MSTLNISFHTEIRKKISDTASYLELCFDLYFSDSTLHMNRQNMFTVIRLRVCEACMDTRNSVMTSLSVAHFKYIHHTTNFRTG